MNYLQVLTPLTDEEKAQYSDYLAGLGESTPTGEEETTEAEPTPTTEENKVTTPKTAATNDASLKAASTGEENLLAASPGRKITLGNGVNLTEQDDGTFKDEEGNKWVMSGEGEDGNEQYRQVGFKEGSEIELNNEEKTKLIAQEDYELDENFELPDDVKFKDEKDNRWVIKEGSFRQIDFDKGTVITLTSGAKLTADSDFSVNEETFDMPDGIYFKDEKDNRWVIKEGSFRQIDFDKGTVITLTSGTKLTADNDFSVNEQTFDMPDGIYFRDEKDNRWVINKSNFQQIDFDKGDVITLTSGTKLTADSDFSLDEKTFEMPDGIYFKDEKDNRWVIKEGSFRQIDFQAGSKITLGNGSVLTNTNAFSYNDDGTMPDGIEFTDQNGNKWITKDDKFQQQGFAAKTISITLQNGAVLTNATPYDLNADGTTPAGVLFTDQNGTMWVSGAGGLFNVFDPNKTPVSGLQIVAKLKGMTAQDAGALLATLDPKISGLLLFDPSVFTDQQLIDVLGGMDPDKAAALLNPFLGTDTYNHMPAYNNPMPGQWAPFSILTNARVSTILAGMDKAKATAILASDKLSVDLAGLILAKMSGQQIADFLTSMSPDRAARIISYGFYTPTTYAYYNYYNPAVDTSRASTLAASIALMDPAKAALILSSDQMKKDLTLKKVGTQYGRALTDEEKAYYGVVLNPALLTGGGVTEVIENGVLTKYITKWMGNYELRYVTKQQVTGSEYLGAETFSSGYHPQGITGGPPVGAGGLAALDPLAAAGIINKLDRATAASILGSLSVDQSSAILGKLDKAKAETFLTELEKTNFAKGDDVSIKLGFDPDINTLTADAGAEYLAGLDSTLAANKLRRLAADKAAAIIASAKMTEAQAIKIMGAMIDLATTVIQVPVPGTGGEDAPPEYTAKTVIDASLVAAILNWKSTDAAASFTGITVDKAANILAGLDTADAALIIASDKISLDNASAILTKANESKAAQVTNILLQLDKTNKAKSDQVRAKIGAVPGEITADASAVYLSALAPTVAATELAKLTVDQQAEIIASPQMSPSAAAKILENLTAEQAAAIIAKDKVSVESGVRILATMDAVKAAALVTALLNTSADKATKLFASSTMNPAAAANIMKAMAADKAAAIVVNGNMSVGATVAILTKLKISDAKKYTEIMAQLALDEANKIKVGQITTEMDKAPSSQKVSSSEQTRLKSIYGYAPAFSTKEVIPGVNGAPDSVKWNYHDQYGNLIGTRVDANPGTYVDYGDGVGGTTYSGYAATYYDINGKVLATSGGGGLQRLSADQANSLTDLFQAKAVYTINGNVKMHAGGTSSGTTSYYDENFNLIGSQNWSTRFAGYGVGFVTDIAGYYDKSGTQIAIGTGAMRNYNPTAPVTRAITAGSAEEQSLLSTFGVAPASARDFTEANYIHGSYATGWGTSGPITTYYDKDGNLLGSKQTRMVWVNQGEVGYYVDRSTWYDKNGDLII
jgi:flagellar motility protein MotE (MotC chaperone)